MSATIFYLRPEVREAALDLKSLRKKIKEAGDRGYQWFPAEANARQRMLHLSLEWRATERRAPADRAPPPRPDGCLPNLAQGSRGPK
jgi:hypothetical protein